MTQQAIRVLHLLRSLGIGGAERRVLRLGMGLDPERYEVHALSLYPAEGKPLDWPHERHRFFPIGPGFQWRRLADLVAYLRDQRFDIVHSHNWATMFYGVVAGRMAQRCGSGRHSVET
jgi:glycosyltransferase involved in cell wall biosynthesis